MAEETRDVVQYLTFTLGGELFALDIYSVREVLEYTQITRVPRTPAYMRGILNVRGNAVPVVDLNMKFGKSPTKQTILTSIIIVEVDVDGEPLVIGALADSVQEVIELREDQIDPPPKMGTSIRCDFIKGMGMQNNNTFIMVLDSTKLFSTEELTAMTGSPPPEGDKAEAALAEA